jgi:hypothetical protein
MQRLDGASIIYVLKVATGCGIAGKSWMCCSEHMCPCCRQVPEVRWSFICLHSLFPLLVVVVSKQVLSSTPSITY